MKILKIAFVILMLSFCSSMNYADSGVYAVVSAAVSTVKDFVIGLSNISDNKEAVKAIECLSSTIQDQAVQQATTAAAVQANLTEINQNVTHIKDGVEIVGDKIGTLQILGGVAAGFVIAQGTYDFGCFVKSKFWPSEKEWPRKKKLLKDYDI